MIIEEKFMDRALYLASMGAGNVSPNPLVGCVIVHEGIIIGEGYHKKFGTNHAEVEAINSVSDPNLLSKATLYVNLEPCSHFGKTPPCADLIIKHKIPQMVVANLDPNPLVSGSGIQRLKNAGINVIEGVLKQEGEILNRRFFKAMDSKRPYIILKWAESADGFVYSDNQTKISNSLSDMEVHKWRSEEDSILVGYNTLKIDNPRLNVRHWPAGKNPTRILLSKNENLNFDLHFFDKSQDSIVFVCGPNDFTIPIESHSIEQDLLKMCTILFEKGIHSMIVEGGPATHQKFVINGLYDEFRIIKSDLILKEGLPACKVPSGIPLQKSQAFKKDTIFYYNQLGY